MASQFQAGASDQALDTARNALQALPNDRQLSVTLTAICLYYQQPQAAKHLLEDAVESAPKDADLRMLLARISLLAEEPEEALAVLRDMPPGVQPPDLFLLKGEAFALTGDLAAATRELASAVKVSPASVACLTTYAWVLQLQGHYGDALRLLAKAGTLDRSSASIPYREAVSYYFLADYTLTEQMSEKALALDPQYAAAFFILGMAQLKQKHLTYAQSNLRKAVALKPDVALFHQELGTALLQGASSAEASKELDQALRLDSSSAEAYFWRAQSSLQQGATQMALADLNTAIRIDPDYSAAYTVLAHIYNEIGQHEEAAQAIAKQKQIHRSSRRKTEERQLLSPPETLRSNPASGTPANHGR